MSKTKYKADRKEVIHDYFQWLCEIVDTDDPDYGYLRLMDLLFGMDFTSETAVLIPNDDNRIQDALDLRDEFIEESFYDDVSLYFEFPCSVLEVLVALSRRMGEFGYEPTEFWFWEMLRNLGLDKYTDDELYGENCLKVEGIVDDFRMRKYSRSGVGGLFPEKSCNKKRNTKCNKDQRRLEIWDQMNLYLIEKYA